MSEREREDLDEKRNAKIKSSKVIRCASEPQNSNAVETKRVRARAPNDGNEGTETITLTFTLSASPFATAAASMSIYYPRVSVARVRTCGRPAVFFFFFFCFGC